MFFSSKSQLTCHKYRNYSLPFFEEIIINRKVGDRAALNFRSRFMTSKEQIFQVLEMYCKKDYFTEFINSRVEIMSKAQHTQLFTTCVSHDSFKIGLQILSNFLTDSDVSEAILVKVINRLQYSVMYHEVKLLLILHFFNKLSVQSINLLLDILISQLVNTQTTVKNPCLSQFNIVKYSVLIVQVCWRVEQRNIFSLVTKS